MTTTLLILISISLLCVACTFYLLASHQHLSRLVQMQVQRITGLVEDNKALLDKLLARHGIMPLHEKSEPRTGRQDVMPLIPPIQAAIVAAEDEESDEERVMFGLSPEKKAEILEAAQRLAS